MFDFYLAMKFNEQFELANQNTSLKVKYNDRFDVGIFN